MRMVTRDIVRMFLSNFIGSKIFPKKSEKAMYLSKLIEISTPFPEMKNVLKIFAF